MGTVALRSFTSRSPSLSFGRSACPPELTVDASESAESHRSHSSPAMIYREDREDGEASKEGFIRVGMTSPRLEE